MGTIRTHYLDASAIVMLLVKELGSDQLHKYLRKYSNFHTTSLCFAEAFGVLKREYHQSQITLEQYLAACDQLVAYVQPENIGIEIEPIMNKNRSSFRDVEKLIKTYSTKTHFMDVSDALLIYALKKGSLSNIPGGPSPILITGDSKLAKAVRGEGLQVWDCKKDPPP
jgi:predicted nucleic acid-binding protein